MTCNFEREDPIERLTATGFAASEPALVIWEGVVPYLTEAAVRATATRLATGLDPRSLVAFDFVGKKLAAGQTLSAEDQQTRAYVGELGEPIRYGTDDLLPLLYECGFRWVRSLDFNELALEMLGDYQRDRQFRFQHIALAVGEARRSPAGPDPPRQNAPPAARTRHPQAARGTSSPEVAAGRVASCSARAALRSNRRLDERHAS